MAKGLFEVGDGIGCLLQFDMAVVPFDILAVGSGRQSHWCSQDLFIAALDLPEQRRDGKIMLACLMDMTVLTKG